MLEEEDEGEREDGLELGAEAAAPPAAAEKAAPAREEEERAPAHGGAPERTPGADGPAPEGAGQTEDDGAGNGAAEFLWDELAAPVMGPNGAAALRRPGAGDVEIAALAGTAEKAAAAEELRAAADTLTAAERGLEGLYRQTVRAGRPAAQALPVEQAGRTVRAEEPGRTAALTVDELDRAVRRDSRRYDGGMTIF